MKPTKGHQGGQRGERKNLSRLRIKGHAKAARDEIHPVEAHLDLLDDQGQEGEGTQRTCPLAGSIEGGGRPAGLTRRMGEQVATAQSLGQRDAQRLSPSIEAIACDQDALLVALDANTTLDLTPLHLGRKGRKEPHLGRLGPGSGGFLPRGVRCGRLRDAP
jgi:hypothetical protein